MNRRKEPKAPVKSTSWSGVFAKARTARHASSSALLTSSSTATTTPTSLLAAGATATTNDSTADVFSDVLSDENDDVYHVTSEWDMHLDAIHSKSDDMLGMPTNVGPLRRKVSVSRLMYTQVSIKEGWLYKQPRSFQRWKKRYFWLKRNKLFYASSKDESIVNEVDLTSVSVAEYSAKSNSFCFQLITPRTVLMLAAESRTELEEWISALKSTKQRKPSANTEEYSAVVNGEHSWFVSSHNRPVYCNVCREALAGVAWHGLSCELCKMKVHKRCAARVTVSCKWTTLTSVISSFDQSFADLISASSHEQSNVVKTMMPHQWVEGNLPMSSKCALCDRACGSVMRLQDYTCLWCHVCVHSCCVREYPSRCTLGTAHLSVLPPVSIRCVNSNGSADVCARDMCSQSTRNTALPLVVFVNSKSGDTQGLRVLRQFKRLLNPIQVYDLINGGPQFGLRLFSSFKSFRVLACGGDGTVGWVLSGIDALNLHSKCYVGILPLGTGNDLSRVLGWGHAFEDNMRLSNLLKWYERAQTGMLDRWSLLTHELPSLGGTVKNGDRPRLVKAWRSESSLTQATSLDSRNISLERSASFDRHAAFGKNFECSVDNHVSRILVANDDATAISSAKVLCETVKTFLVNVGEIYRQSEEGYNDDHVAFKCSHLQQKLDNLLKALRQESLRVEAQREESGIEREESSSDDAMPDLSPNTSERFKQRRFVQREHLMLRANSLKKAVKDIVDHADRVVDSAAEVAAQTASTSRRRSRRQRQQRAINRQLHSTRDIKTSSPIKRHPSSFSVVTSSPQTTRHMQQLIFNNSSSPPISPIEVVSEGLPLITHPQTISDVVRTTSSSNAADWMLGESSKAMNICSTSDTLDDEDTSSCGALATLPLTGQSELSDLNVPDSSTSHDQPSFPNASKSRKHRQPSPNMFRVRALSHRSDPNLRQMLIGDSSPELAVPHNHIVRKHSFESSVHATPPSVLPDLLEDLNGRAAACANPMSDMPPASAFTEKHVINNYFGIGLDAKIALEFHRKREEYASASRSRSKLYIWYGMLGGKELWKRTYRNLERRVHLMCDGRPIQLPALQGLVVLNIPSYQGGMNFWGSSTTSGKRKFLRQSFDDRILEVVAVYGVMHCATSRVVRLQNHRIAQCREVVVRITGNQPIAMQVDGEAWMQPPGVINIVHKNRAQVLIRNARFDATLRTWDEQQVDQEHRVPRALATAYMHDECQLILSFIHNAHILCHTMRRSLPLVYYYPPHTDSTGNNGNTCSPMVYMIGNVPQTVPHRSSTPNVHRLDQRTHYDHRPSLRRRCTNGIRRLGSSFKARTAARLRDRNDGLDSSVMGSTSDQSIARLLGDARSSRYTVIADGCKTSNTAPDDWLVGFAPGSLMLSHPYLVQDMHHHNSRTNDNHDDLESHDARSCYDNFTIRPRRVADGQVPLKQRPVTADNTPTHMNQYLKDTVLSMDALTDHLWQEKARVAIASANDDIEQAAATQPPHPPSMDEPESPSYSAPTASFLSNSSPKTVNYKNRFEFYRAVEQLQQELDAVGEILAADQAMATYTLQSAKTSGIHAPPSQHHSSVPVIVASSTTGLHVPDRPSDMFDSFSPESTKRIIRSQSDRPIYEKSAGLALTDRGASPSSKPISPGIVQRSSTDSHTLRKQQRNQQSTSAHSLPRRFSASRLGKWLRNAAARLKTRRRSSTPAVQQTDPDEANSALPVETWSVAQVSEWLADVLNLPEYSNAFSQHEIGGHELMRLNRNDLQDIGVHKVGHIKRLESGILRLSGSEQCGISYRVPCSSSPSIPSKEASAEPADMVIDASISAHHRSRMVKHSSSDSKPSNLSKVDEKSIVSTASSADVQNNK